MNDLVPSEFYLAQNYPDPFKEKTIIKYCVAYKTRVQITVYDSDGVLIEKLVDEEKKPGTYEVEFNKVETHQPAGRQGRDVSLQSRTYSYRLEAGNYSSDKKMQLLK